MDKILIEVFFPSLGMRFDVEIPTRMRFHKLADLIERAVSRITGGAYVATGEALICDCDTGVPFDINLWADKQCLHNGSKVMII